MPAPSKGWLVSRRRTPNASPAQRTGVFRSGCRAPLPWVRYLADCPHERLAREAEPRASEERRGGREGDPGGRLHRDARARQRPRSPRSRVMSSPAIRAPSLRLLTGATPVRQHRFRPSQGRHRCCRPCESRVRRELVLYAGGPLASVIFVVCAWPEVSVQPIVTVSLGWCVSMRVLSCVSD
jgi:hypothetical protein